MIRIKRGKVARKRRKVFLKLAKGYVGSASKLSTFAMEQVIQSLNFAYVGRKLKKRDFRRIWISRINSVLKVNGYKYSEFFGNLRKLNIYINRKILSSIIFNDYACFNSLIKLIF